MNSILRGIKVLLGPSSFGSLDQEPIEKLKADGYEVIPNPYNRKLTKREVLDLLKDDVLGIIAGLEPLDREVLEKSNLKVISRCGSGMSNVDEKAATELGIMVRYTPDGPTLAVAELTVGAMLGLLRMIPQFNSDLHCGYWNKRIGRQLSGMTIAIVGFGKIGRQVALLLKPFEVKILAVDPDAGASGGFDDAEFLPLEEAIKRADLITLHCSGEEVILGADEFTKMKDGVFILNSARGANIDEHALIKALESGKVAGAWLDTFCREPYDGPLKNHDRVILTPHVGSYTLEGRKSMELAAANNLIEAFLKLSHG